MQLTYTVPKKKPHRVLWNSVTLPTTVKLFESKKVKSLCLIKYYVLN
jgi:hypothetical protein